MIAHLLEDGLNTSGVWQVNLEFRTLLVFAGLRRAFVCEHSAAVGDTHPNQFAVLAERALRVVEQGIRFQRARFCGMKTKLAQPSPDFSKLAVQTVCFKDAKHGCQARAVDSRSKVRHIPAAVPHLREVVPPIIEILPRIAVELVITQQRDTCKPSSRQSFVSPSSW